MSIYDQHFTSYVFTTFEKVIFIFIIKSNCYVNNIYRIYNFIIFRMSTFEILDKTINSLIL